VIKNRVPHRVGVELGFLLLLKSSSASFSQEAFLMRQFSWILAVFLFVVVGGCGGGGEPDDTPNSDDSTSSEMTDEELDDERSLE